MKPYFFESNPDGEPDGDPEVGETYWPRTAEDLWPGQIVHIKSDDNLGMNRATRKLFLNSKVEYDALDYEPGFDYTGRIGVMRVYQSVDGELFDGYLVDIRPMDPRNMRGYDLLDADASYDGEKPPESNTISVFGHVYLNVEGKYSFKGDPRLEEIARYLAEEVDKVFWSDSTTEVELQPDEDVDHDEESAPIPDIEQ
jgi:hypothetical protein